MKVRKHKVLKCKVWLSQRRRIMPTTGTLQGYTCGANQVGTREHKCGITERRHSTPTTGKRAARICMCKANQVASESCRTAEYE
eukprot:957287-Pelagomonas_calceolata.AAC.1